MLRRTWSLLVVGGFVAATATSAWAVDRAAASQKGSILYYSKIELKWNAAGALIQDTFITLVNDLNRDVCVEWKFVNGDAPLAAVPGVERAHRGWNMYNCSTCYTPHENVYMSMARGGGSLGCGSFNGLDPGSPPGRPDNEAVIPGDRVLRGFAVAYAVDLNGIPIAHDHLSGHVDIVNYRERSAWEFNTYAFQCLAVGEGPVNAECCAGAGCTSPTVLSMDGVEYENAWDQILFDFYAVGSTAFTLNAANTVTLDTDLTLHPVSLDTRPNATNTDGPVLTKAEIVIWNENEDDRTGTSRCITCWDQTLLSNYGSPNNFLIGLLNTDKGKARINGVQADDCDAPGACCCATPHIPGTCFDPDCDKVDIQRGTPDRDCSENAALLGVSDKILAFSGSPPLFPAAGSRTDAGMTLVAIGTQAAEIRRDVIPATAPFTDSGSLESPEEVQSEISISSPRPISRGQRRDKD